MKKQAIFFSLILFVSLFFAACGGDGDNKNKYDLNGVCKHSVNLKGYADQSNITLTSTIGIDQMLIAYEYEPPITAGVFYKTDSNTGFKITNLAEGIVLSNVVLNINGNTHRFQGNITHSNANLYTNETSAFFEKVFNSMVSQRKLNINITFNLNQDIVPEQNINLDLSFSGRFTYWK